MDQSRMSGLFFGGCCDRYFWDIRLKIYRLRNCNMFFQVVLIKFFKKRTVFVFTESRSRDQLMQKAYCPLLSTWIWHLPFMTFMSTKKVILSLSIASYSHHQSLLFLDHEKLSFMGHFGQELQPPLECHKSFKPADRFTDQRLVSPKSQQLFGPRRLSNVCCVYLSSLSRSRVTALFTNMRTLKFKSRIHNCVFRCRQS